MFSGNQQSIYYFYEGTSGLVSPGQSFPWFWTDDQSTSGHELVSQQDHFLTST